ncbi:discoidin domain-containing protein [Saccharothrix sp. S26]|uniref:discoidin domain-containing protein n=1 Tax=Saccharothrix sp. S26 TaxID=2907215 RepID=UPI001F25364D|nr:discoidin domain-containing protein [Saccharothrix sp. S26]MCE6998342.1 discoidin domain-containing protein [Saccharothrix sp. S26]
MPVRRRTAVTLLGAALALSFLPGQATAAPEPATRAAAVPTNDDVVISQRLQTMVRPVLTAVAADTNVRALVRTIAARQSDGDTNALLSTVVREAEESRIVNPTDPRWVALKSSITQLADVNGFAYHPQVYIPNLDEGIVTSTSVVVAVAPADETLNAIPGYVLNSSGQVQQTPTAIDEAYTDTKEVWVLSANEPVTTNPTAALRPVALDEAGPGALATCNPTGARNDKGLEYLQKWRVPNRGEFGGWFEGKREMRAIILTTTGVTIRTIAFPGIKKKYIDRWQNSDIFITTWDRAQWGDVLGYQWYEEDGGPEVAIGVSIPFSGGTINANVKWHKRDDNGGSAAVMFSESTYLEYNTGKVSFATCSQGGDGGTGYDNFARTGIASASSTYPGYSPARVNDGSANTSLGGSYSWANNAGTYPPGSPEWVQVDFGVDKTFRRVVVYTSAGYPIKDFDVQVWNGVTFVSAASVRNNTALSTTVVFGTGARTSRLVRILGLSGPTHQAGFVRVNELEVYAA